MTGMIICVVTDFASWNGDRCPNRDRVARIGSSESGHGYRLPTAGVLALKSWVDANQATVQKVVDALVATMHWINTHTAAQIAAKMPSDFVSNSLTSRTDYITALATDKGSSSATASCRRAARQKVYEVEKMAGKITKPVNFTTTYTNKYAIKANQLLGLTKDLKKK
jgi:NitT/TauT family transport system substrate-binding protein